MKFLEEEIVRLTENIWASILGLEVANTKAQVKDGQGFVSSFVKISGGFEGVVGLRCSRALAQKAASIMLDTREEDLSVSDIQDVINELANITGGNIKPLMPGPSHLSPPIPKDATGLPSQSALAQLAFLYDGEPFFVTIFKTGESR